MSSENPEGPGNGQQGGADPNFQNINIDDLNFSNFNMNDLQHVDPDILNLLNGVNQQLVDQSAMQGLFPNNQLQQQDLSQMPLAFDQSSFEFYQQQDLQYQQVLTHHPQPNVFPSTLDPSPQSGFLANKFYTDSEEELNVFGQDFQHVGGDADQFQNQDQSMIPSQTQSQTQVVSQTTTTTTTTTATAISKTFPELDEMEADAEGDDDMAGFR